MATLWLKLSAANFLLILCSFCLAVFSASTSPQAPSASSGPLVLLVSFDGFRWDYLDRTDTPNFDRFIQDGVKAKYIVDTFASKTFPNHYTIATGLYEESHGLVGNNMYDPLWNETFSMRTMDGKWWNEGEPIWVTNQRQGGHSGLIMYPGMDIKIRGQYPSYRLPKYNASFPYQERIDIMTHLFANGSINLGLLYFSEPDHSGHMLGPESPDMVPIIKMCDTTLGKLMDKLRSAGLEDRVNVIVTSDHGMTEVSFENATQLDDFVDPSLYYYTNNNPVIGIWPYEENDIEVIYNKLRNASPNVMVYKKDEIPEQYHYHDNRRISPILLVAKEGWSIYRGNQSWSPHSAYRGNHGYNNSLMSMHPIFVAHGPSFKQGLLVEPFENVNIYPLICQLLGIEPAPNNGSLEKVRDLLISVPTIAPPTSEKPKTPTSSVLSTILPTTETPTASVLSTILPTTNGPIGLTSGTIIGIAVAGSIAVIAGCLLLAMCAKQRSYLQQPREYTPIADTSLDAVDNMDDSGFASYHIPNSKV